MTGIRRTLLLLSLTVAAICGGLGPAHPAQAAFSEKVSVPSMQVTTGTVLGPASVTATLACTYTGTTGATLSASWPASATGRVDGYLLTVVFSDGYKQAAPMQAGTTWSTPMTLFNATKYSMHVTVAAHTNYGWTSVATSSVGELKC
jgi:hypothetical protein